MHPHDNLEQMEREASLHDYLATFPPAEAFDPMQYGFWCDPKLIRRLADLSRMETCTYCLEPAEHEILWSDGEPDSVCSGCLKTTVREIEAAGLSFVVSE